MIVKDLSKSYNPVPKMQKKTVEKPTEMKKKSSKLAKLERQRDKDIVKSGICESCKQYKDRLDTHEIYRRKQQTKKYKK